MNKKRLYIYIFLLVILPIISITLMVFFNFNYYLAITIILLSILLSLFIEFEKSKPKAREVALLSILIAISIALRAIFIWFPQFKPGLAIVIITGITLGPVKGFMAGSLSMLLSNIIFGQGPWTPWQMFAFGIIGFISGFIGDRFKSKIGLSIYGFLSVILIVGPILDTQSALFILSDYSFNKLMAVYGSGFIMNIIHGLAVGIFLFLIGEDFIKKINRLKKKYGDISG